MRAAHLKLLLDCAIYETTVLYSHKVSAFFSHNDNTRHFWGYQNGVMCFFRAGCRCLVHSWKPTVFGGLTFIQNLFPAVALKD